MAFKTDGGGIAFKSTDIKLTGEASTWGTRLSQLSKQSGLLRLITYSLPKLSYVEEQLGRRPNKIFVIAHKNFEASARDIKDRFPDIRIAIAPNVHSKVLLIEPNTIWISSANFGDSGWHETSIGVRSAEALDWYVNSVFNPLWNRCREILLP